MSETKRPTGTSRSPRKKTTRSAKSEEPQAEPVEKKTAAVEVKRDIQSDAKRDAQIEAKQHDADYQGEDDRHEEDRHEDDRDRDQDYDEDDGHDGPASPRDERDDDRYEDSRDTRGRHDQGAPRRDAAPAGPQNRPTDEYLLQVYFDKAARVFVASVLEFPEIKATGNHRDGVVRDLENRLNNHLQNLRRRNEPVPEGYQNRKAVEPLEIQVSQSLFRKLDQLSRLERVPLEQLISEMLAGALERRGEKRHEGGGQPRHQQHSQNRDRDNRGNREQSGNREGQGNRNHQPRHGRGGGRHNINETLDNRENFMEYVRNLEKGNWRKR